MDDAEAPITFSMDREYNSYAGTNINQIYLNNLNYDNSDFSIVS